MSATLIEHPATNLMDVAARLRDLAQHIEEQKAGERWVTAIVVCANEDGTVAISGYGQRVSALETSGWLSRALTAMNSGYEQDDGDPGVSCA